MVLADTMQITVQNPLIWISALSTMFNSKILMGHWNSMIQYNLFWKKKCSHGTFFPMCNCPRLLNGKLMFWISSTEKAFLEAVVLIEWEKHYLTMKWTWRLCVLQVPLVLCKHFGWTVQKKKHISFRTMHPTIHLNEIVHPACLLKHYN